MDHDDHDQSPLLGRRSLLRSAGALSLLGLGGRALALPSPFAPTLRHGWTFGTDDLVRDTAAAGMCVLTAQQTEGPYYIDPHLVRQDITEGLPGIPVRLRLWVLQASDCTPVANAAVDIWHTDHVGRYSGFTQEGTLGQTFMRGIQRTGPTGLAEFDSIYPGWYSSRTAHIHMKVHLGAQTALTSQMYFDQHLTDRVYQRPPYAARGPAQTVNATDGIYAPENEMTFAGVQGGRGVLEFVIGVA